MIEIMFVRLSLKTFLAQSKYYVFYFTKFYLYYIFLLSISLILHIPLLPMQLLSRSLKMPLAGNLPMIVIQRRFKSWQYKEDIIYERKGSKAL